MDLAEYENALKQYSAEDFTGISERRCTQMEFYHVKTK